MGLKRKVRRVHFVGIGGIGQSGIAEVLHAQGFEVTGSDMKASDNVARLRGKGISVTVPHSAEAVIGACVCVVSTAIPQSNPEVVEARKLNIPVIRRAEMLAELLRLQPGICIAGQHGKTTTTSMVADVLTHGGADPTVINGGVLASLGSNARFGKGGYLVCEADESDGSFLALSPTYAVITNLEGADHLETWPDGMDSIKDAFLRFANSVPFYGLVILCHDDEHLRELLPQLKRRYVTYGGSASADYRAEHLRHEDGKACFTLFVRGERKGEIRLPTPGRHNVLNSLASIAIADEFDLPFLKIKEALESFRGVARRFDVAGTFGGVTVVHDYGHHPTEISAVLSAAREAWPERCIRVLFQPHRWSRLRDQWQAFGACFDVAHDVVMSEVYAAGETPPPGFSEERFAAEAIAHGHRSVRFAGTAEKAAEVIADSASAGDLILVFGAGDINRHVPSLCQRLESSA
jgi:UDP-N-acetylmuramate--alanine ligase